MADISKIKIGNVSYTIKSADSGVSGVKGNSESSYRTGNVNITAANIGLGNVNNTSDANKPISTATQNALNLKMNASLKGAASGVAELDENGLVPSSQLPSFVDDVLEYTALASFPSSGVTGKIYVDTTTNKTYRWSGSAYVEISASLALGETSSTAYRGDRGKTAYTHAAAKGAAFTSGLYKITTNEHGHVTAATAVTKADITALGIPGSDTNTNTTYTLTQDATDGHKFTLTGSDGTSTTITIPDNNTTYSLSSLGIGNVKNYDQSKAIKSITRSGTTFTYTCLDNTTGTFTQQDNNTWTAMVGATSSANGTAGYVPAPPKDGYNTKFLRADGTWNVPVGTTYSNKAAASGGTDVSLVTTGEKYTWNAKTNNTGTVTNVSTGAGLTGGNITTTGTVKAKLLSETLLTNNSAAATETAGRVYPVALDKSGNLAVNVPWSDTNTKVTSAANHYTPSRDTSADKTASASGATAAWGIDVVKGVTIQTDAKGHVTGVEVESGKLPTNPNIVPSAYCTTAAGTAAKVAACSGYALLSKSYIHIIITNTNTAASALTLNINSKGAKPIFINGAASSASNHTLPAGSYLVYYNGTNYYFRTDGKLTASITSDAGTVNGKSVGRNVPSDAKFCTFVLDGTTLYITAV